MTITEVVNRGTGMGLIGSPFQTSALVGTAKEVTNHPENQDSK